MNALLKRASLNEFAGSNARTAGFIGAGSTLLIGFSNLAIGQTGTGPARSSIYRLTLIKGAEARISNSSRPPFDITEVDEPRDVLVLGGERLIAINTRNTYTVRFELLK